MPAANLTELNQLPQNQIALRWLKQAKAEADPTKPYLLQLLWWGVEESGLKFPDQPDQGYDRKERLLQATLDLLNDLDPQRAVEYVLQDENLPWPNLERAETPEDAASLALDALESLLDSDPSLDRNPPID